MIRCDACDAPTASLVGQGANEYGEFICKDCEQNRAESAWERHCEDFHDGGCTRFNPLRDDQAAAQRFK